MILNHLQVDGGIPVVLQNTIIGLYTAGQNWPMVCLFVRLSRYYQFIRKVLDTKYEEQSGEEHSMDSGRAESSSSIGAAPKLLFSKPSSK